MLYGAADTALSIYVPSVCPIIRNPMKSLLSTHTALQLSALTDDFFTAICYGHNRLLVFYKRMFGTDILGSVIEVALLLLSFMAI